MLEGIVESEVLLVTSTSLFVLPETFSKTCSVIRLFMSSGCNFFKIFTEVLGVEFFKCPNKLSPAE
jgi:hypothetical protein